MTGFFCDIDVSKKLKKITWNPPVEEKFVLNPSDWFYSSDSNYFESRGVIEEVYCLPGRLVTV